MERLQDVFGATAMRNKIIAGFAAAGMFAAILAMTGLASKPSMTLLYSNLEASQSGEIVKALEARGVHYEIRAGAIFVESRKRDALRMTLASEGLPANSTKGYELLDSLTGFGTTSQMFDAAYWRAKEGELARTIAASPLVSQARVHIANISRNPFQRNSKPTASVAVTSADGALPSSHAKALRYLVASAVAGLDPEDVSVVDDKGGLIGLPDEARASEAGLDKAEAIRAKVQNLLEAHVGIGNAVVEISVDTVTETESIKETVIDPASRVAVSTDTQERTGTSKEASGGAVTVASNLPDGAANGDDQSSSQNSETRERVNYEVSESFREVLRAPGAIRRLSVAVLVNGAKPENESTDAEFEPRSEAELADIRELVASAVGYDEARGDVITIKSLPFESVQQLGTAASPTFLDNLALDVMSLVQMGVLGVVALVLGLFVLRPILSKPEEPAMIPPPASAPFGGEAAALTGEVSQAKADTAPEADIQALSNASPTSIGDSAEDPVERLRNLISDRQDETVEILRNWLEDREEAPQ